MRWRRMLAALLRTAETHAWLKFPRQRLGKVRIQYKILGLAVGPMLLLSTMMVWQMGNILTTNLRDQLDKRLISIGSDTVARATNELLINNTYAVYELLQNTLKNNEDVVYLFVVDPTGDILAHTFGQAFPNELLPVNSLHGEENYHLTVFRSEAGIVRDVAVPILDGKLGTVRVGMTEIGLRLAVWQMTWKVLLIALFVSTLGIVAAVLLTRVLVRPIRELVTLTQRVAAGELDVSGQVHDEDEIGLLTGTFNEMTKSLSQSHREREELLNQLREKEELRLQLLDKVITAQEDERKRISRELHDETSQSLTSLMVGLKLLETEASYCAVGERLEEMRQIVSGTLEEIHHLARELRPSVLDDMGLVAAIERYVRDYGRKYPIEVDFHVIGFENRRLSLPTEVAIYRIVQEALTNVAKYSGSDSVSVLLDWRGEWVLAIIEDNGQGFNVEEVTAHGQGLGLFGMQERAALLGGTLKIESQPGVGTTVFIKLPVKTDKAAVKEVGT